MKNERIAEHLMAAIVLLKSIQQKNLEQNAEIQSYLDKLIAELEDKKKEEEQKQEESDKGEKKPKPDEVKPEGKDEDDAETEKDAKITGDALTKIMEMIAEKSITTGFDMGLVEVKEIEEAKAVEAVEAKRTYVTKEPKGTPPKKRPKGAVVGGGYGAASPVEDAKEDAPNPDDMPGIVAPGKVWCTVCEEFHDVATHEEVNDDDIPF